MTKQADKPHESRGDARGYSWEPFTEGNTANLRHGAHSERKVGPLAAEIAAEAVEAVPFLAAPRFRRSLEAWSRAEAQATLLSAYVDEVGLIGEDGKPNVSLDWLTRIERLAAEHRRALGMDPASAVKIERDLVAIAGPSNLEALAAEGRRALEARENGGGS